MKDQLKHWSIKWTARFLFATVGPTHLACYSMKERRLLLVTGIKGKHSLNRMQNHTFEINVKILLLALCFLPFLSMFTTQEERLLCYIRLRYWLGNDHSQIVVPAPIVTYCSRAIQLTFLCICLPSCVMGIRPPEKDSITLNLYKTPKMKQKYATPNKMSTNKKCIATNKSSYCILELVGKKYN